MKVAVLSDVHGFSIALDRVLADIATEPGIDLIVVAGDLAEGGPDPAGALARLRESGAVLLQGNTDRDLADGARGGKTAKSTAEAIGDEGLAFLSQLPFSYRITPEDGSSPDDDLLIVHANPFDMDRPIDPQFSAQQVDELIGDTRAAVIAFGHIHIAYIREHRTMKLVDVSAAGNPKDGDLRSKWGLMNWDEASRAWSAELRYVDYPLEETIQQFRDSGFPKADSAIKKLIQASYVD